MPYGTTHSITPGTLAGTKVVVPVPAGTQASVKKYEASVTDEVIAGRTPDEQKLATAAGVVLIGVPTPAALEVVRDGWAYLRPTQGPHKGTFLMVRAEYLAPLTGKK